MLVAYAVWEVRSTDDVEPAHHSSADGDAVARRVLASFFQGLADPTRVRILELLRERPRTVSELVAELGLAQGRVSSHLSCLRWCGYVLGEVEGRFTRYRLIDDRVREILRLGEEIVRDNADRLTSCLVLGAEERP